VQCGFTKKEHLTLREDLAQVPPVDMWPLNYYLSLTQIKLGCAVTVHDAQSLRIKGKLQVKCEFPACQLATVEQDFLVV
jgi:hypothetical protein